MKNHTFVGAVLVVEMTRNITKLTAILQVITKKTFDKIFKNDPRKCALCVYLTCQCKVSPKRLRKIGFILFLFSIASSMLKRKYQTSGELHESKI